MVWPVIILMYSLLKKRSPFSLSYIQSSHYQDQTNVVILQTFLKIDTLVLIIMDFSPLFGLFSCFTWTCIVFVFDQSTIHIIFILILSIHSTLILLVFIYNQIFLCNLGLQNWTSDHHHLWIKSAFESNLSYNIICIFY